MALRKCPKCELNYIKGDAEFCDVCLREMKKAIRRGHDEEEEEQEVLMCSECGEAPAVRGSELCAECLREAKRQTELENASDLDAEYDDSASEEDLEESGEESEE